MGITLYPYQQEAVDFAYNKEGVLLADEMGTGKTVSTLGEIRTRYGDNLIGKVLIIVPNTAKSVWEDHCRIMLPHWPITVVPSSPKRNEVIASYESGFLIIHWEGIRVSPGLLQHVWDYVVADEAHMAKNRKAKRTRSLKRIRTKYKRALSGTPLVNRPDELWSILNWLYPKFYRSFWKFWDAYVDWEMDERFGYRVFKGAKNTEALRKTIAPFTIRRLKKDVLPDLPEKYYTHIAVELKPEQKRAYERMKKHMVASIKEDEILQAPTVLAQLTRLRQFATAYAEFGEDNRVLLSEPSSKLDSLMEIIESSDKAPVVVFSQFKQLIGLAAKRLDEAGITYNILTGDTPSDHRGAEVASFQNGESQVFLSTMQTGGIGITLHRASTAVFLDRSWSPAMNLQAEDRLHRSGQKNAVQIIILQAVGTVDYAVEEKLEMKWSIIRKILGDV